MDKAYCGKKLREVVFQLVYKSVVFAKKNNRISWDYNKELYKRRNEVEIV